MKHSNINPKLQPEDNQNLTKRSSSKNTNVIPQQYEISDADITPKIKALSDWLEKNIGKDAKDESKYCEKVERVLQILSMKISSFDKSMFIQILILANNYAHYLMVGCEFDKAEIVLIFWMEKSNCLEFYPWSMLLMSTYCNQLINIKDSTRVINQIDLRLKKFEQDLTNFVRKNELDDTERLQCKSIISILICYKTASLNTLVSTGLSRDLRIIAIDNVKKHFQNDSRLLKALKKYHSTKLNRNSEHYKMDQNRDRYRKRFNEDELSIQQTQTYRYNSKHHQINLNGDGASTYQTKQKNNRIRMKSKRNQDFTKNQSVDGKIQNKNIIFDENSNNIFNPKKFHLSEKNLYKKINYDVNSMPSSFMQPNKKKDKQDLNNVTNLMNQNFQRQQQFDNKFVQSYQGNSRSNDQFKNKNFNNDLSLKNGSFVLKMKKNNKKRQNDVQRDHLMNQEMNQNNNRYNISDNLINNSNNLLNSPYENNIRNSKNRIRSGHNYSKSAMNYHSIGYNSNTESNLNNNLQPRNMQANFFGTPNSEIQNEKMNELLEMQEKMKDQKEIEEGMLESYQQLKNMQNLYQTFSKYKTDIYTLEKTKKNEVNTPKKDDSESKRETLSKQNIKIRKSSIQRAESKNRERSPANISATELKQILQKNNSDKAEKKLLQNKIELLQSQVKQAKINMITKVEKNYVKTPINKSEKELKPTNLNIVQPFSKRISEVAPYPQKSSLKSSQNATPKSMSNKKVSLIESELLDKRDSPSRKNSKRNSLQNIESRDEESKFQDNNLASRKYNKFEDYYYDVNPIEERATPSESMNPTIKPDTQSTTSKFIDEKTHMNLINKSTNLAVISQNQINKQTIVKSEYNIDVPQKITEIQQTNTLATSFPKKYNTMMTNMEKAMNPEKPTEKKLNDKLVIDLNSIESFSSDISCVINEQIKEDKSKEEKEMNAQMNPSIPEFSFPSKATESNINNECSIIENKVSIDKPDYKVSIDERTFKELEDNSVIFRANTLESEVIKVYRVDGPYPEVKTKSPITSKTDLFQSNLEQSNGKKQSSKSNLGSFLDPTALKSKKLNAGFKPMTPQHSSSRGDFTKAAFGMFVQNTIVKATGVTNNTGEKVLLFDQIFNKVKSELVTKNENTDKSLDKFTVFYKTMLVSMLQFKRYVHDHLFTTLEYKLRTHDDIFRIRFVTKPNIDTLIFTIIVQTDSSSTNTRRITQISDFLNESQFQKLFYVLPWMNICPINNPISTFLNFNKFLDKMFFPFVSIDENGDIAVSRIPRSLIADDQETFLGVNVTIKMIHLHDNVTRVFLQHEEKMWFFDIWIDAFLFWNYYHEQPSKNFHYPVFHIFDRKHNAKNHQDCHMREPLKPKSTINDLIKRCIKIFDGLLTKDDWLTDGKTMNFDVLVKKINKDYHYFKIINEEKVDFYRVRIHKKTKKRMNHISVRDSPTKQMNSSTGLPDKQPNLNESIMQKPNTKQDTKDHLGIIFFILNAQRKDNLKMKRILERSYMNEEIGDWVWEKLQEEYKIFFQRRFITCTKMLEYHNTAVLQIRHTAGKDNKYISRFHMKINNYICIATVRFAYVGYVLSGIQIEIYNPGLVQKKNILFQLDENSNRMKLGPLSKQIEEQIESELKENIEKIVKKRLKDNLEDIFDEKTPYQIHSIETILNHEQKIMINDQFKKLI